MKPNITWILVADGGRARVLTNSGPGKGMTQVEGLDFQDQHLRARDIDTDRPGRSYSSAGHGRSAIEPHSSPVEQREMAFVGKLAELLEARRSAGEFQRLVIVASPVALGELRGVMSEPLKAAIVATLPKDLTKVPTAELPKHLDEVLAL